MKRKIRNGIRVLDKDAPLVPTEGDDRESWHESDPAEQLILQLRHELRLAQDPVTARYGSTF